MFKNWESLVKRGPEKGCKYSCKFEVVGSHLAIDIATYSADERTCIGSLALAIACIDKYVATIIMYSKSCNTRLRS